MLAAVEQFSVKLQFCFGQMCLYESAYNSDSADFYCLYFLLMTFSCKSFLRHHYSIKANQWGTAHSSIAMSLVLKY